MSHHILKPISEENIIKNFNKLSTGNKINFATKLNRLDLLKEALYIYDINKRYTRRDSDVESSIIINFILAGHNGFDNIVKFLYENYFDIVGKRYIMVDHMFGKICQHFKKTSLINLIKIANDEMVLKKIFEYADISYGVIEIKPIHKEVIEQLKILNNENNSAVIQNNLVEEGYNMHNKPTRY